MASFPIVIDDGTQGFTQPNKPGFGGPYFHGVQTGVRLVFAGADASGSASQFGVYKSVDSGATWILAATSDPINFGGLVFTTVQKNANTVVILFYSDDTIENLTGIEYDLNNDTFGAAFGTTIAVNNSAAVIAKYDFDSKLVIAGSFSQDMDGHPFASWATWDGAAWSALTLFPAASATPSDLANYVVLDMCLCNEFMQVVLLWGSEGPPTAPHPQMYGTIIGGGTIQPIINGFVHFNESYGWIPTSIVYDGNTDTVFLVTTQCGVDDLTPDNTVLHVAKQANDIAIPWSLTPIDAGSTDDTDVVADVSAVQIDIITFVFWKMQEETLDPFPGILNMFTSVDGVTFTPIIEIGELDNLSQLCAANVSGLTGWALAFLGSQDYWEIAGPIAVPGFQTIVFTPVILPDPAIHCVRSLWQKCYVVDTCNNTILRSKAPMSLIDYNSLQVSLLQNQVVPPEGPRTVPIRLDFGNTGEIDVDLGQLQQRGFLNMVQTIFVDMNGAPNNLLINVNGTGQQIVCKVNTQGYYTILCPNPVKISFVSTQGGPIISAFLCNSPIPGAVWATQ